MSHNFLHSLYRVFGKRDQSQGATVDLKGVIKRLNGIMRDWSDSCVESGEVDGHKSVIVYRLNLNDFASLFA